MKPRIMSIETEITLMTQQTVTKRVTERHEGSNESNESNESIPLAPLAPAMLYEGNLWLFHLPLHRIVLFVPSLKWLPDNSSASLIFSVSPVQYLLGYILYWEADGPSVGKYSENNALEQPPQDRKHISWKTIVHFLSHRKASLTFLTNNFPYYPLPFI